MVNGFEYTKLKVSKLPLPWQEDGQLEALEKFLQSNWEQRGIFYSDGEVTSRQRFIDFDKKNGIKLLNYIGTIVFRGEQLNIFPKLFKEDEDDYDTENLKMDELIQNIVIWLGYCDKLNFPFISIKSQLNGAENFLELFITVYVHYVKATIDRQLFFRYEDVVETGSFVKGKIDFRDYAINKYPTGRHHQMEYVYSSFIFDNLLNRIIKNTCIMLLSITRQPANKRLIRHILMKLGDVGSVNCQPTDCDLIHLSALHSNYRIILSMSKMFLLSKVSSNNIGRTEAFCFLFPAEQLFEGFVSGFIKEMFHKEARVSTQSSDQYLAELYVDDENLGSVFQLREDILIEYDDGIIVLDTKYKEIERFDRITDNRKLGISDSDMKQMAIYAAKRGAQKVFLLYPLHRGEFPETKEIRFNINLNSSNSHIPLYILKVPFIFGEDVNETKQILKDILKRITA